MDSANLHHQHHLQDQLVQSSPLASPSCYGVGTTHDWTPNTILSTGNFNQNINSYMIQDLGFHWGSTGGSLITSQSAHDLQNIARIKEELSDSFPKFTELLINSPSSSLEDLHNHPTSYIKNERRDLNDMNEKLLLRTFSSGCQINGLHLPVGEFYSNSQTCSNSGSGITPSRGTFSQILPTINVPNFNQPSTAISSSLDMNLEALDLFNSGRFSGSFSQPSHDHDHLLSYGIDHMQQLSNRPSNSPTKVSTFTTGATDAKRPSSFLEPKAPQAASKKSRLDSRASCPPIKVRKEKLGDRIAALQQLVAPFGKTDTASVLMEAFGYIKFLQSQVETLSVPYMKSSRNKTSRSMQGGLSEDGDEKAKKDLRSRGLCLVPLSCLSYLTDGGGCVWPPLS